ncbi:MAG: DUF4433 domain-containing protein [Firmicutes bacterium]|nr:DUF4433 domain-containing protein [Bacillota bacterium]
MSDQNAASGYARFHRFPDGLRYLDYDTIFARSWVHIDQRETWRHKAAMCAEVLVPNKVEPRYIMGGYVSSDATGRFILDRHSDFALIINSDLFFL